ncbi:pyridoxamine 5'-phosphate oxidase [Streptomyces sp. I05A-00742]|uniref:pyridoxamine 5'-phosphate oxidase n=1 Tax=Streptomyces sp. I05A-00742 TaxID=2732853 RepID=UPI002017E5C1|nr:pyridoxamine 5'-phosphate oxidase [Streptomyces sp. I05A-00742]
MPDVFPFSPAGDPDGALDPAVMRAQYRTAGLLESDLAGSPYRQFARWFAEATASGLEEPNAMVVSTADRTGRPSSRTVLLKAFDERGFVFFTNYGSRKGLEIAGNPYVSLLFPWHPIARQVMVAGRAERVAPEETAAYFHSRPHGSQVGALASAQSTVVGSRAEIDAAYARLAARYPEGTEVPVPTEWGGLRVVPESVEFWQGRENRLHDRLRFVRVEGEAEGAGREWRVERLCP